MKPLSLVVALFGLLALVPVVTGKDVTTAGLAAAALICAFTTFRSASISSLDRSCQDRAFPSCAGRSPGCIARSRSSCSICTRESTPISNATFH